MAILTLTHALRSILLHDATFAQAQVLNGPILSHIGNAPHTYFITIQAILLLGRLVNKRFLIGVLTLSALVAIYINFDVEMDALPFFTMGTTDLWDIPMGLVGVLLGIVTGKRALKKLAVRSE